MSEKLKPWRVMSKTQSAMSIDFQMHETRKACERGDHLARRASSGWKARTFTGEVSDE